MKVFRFHQKQETLARTPTPEFQRWLQGADAFDDGKKLYDEREYESALSLFDFAIANGYGKQDYEYKAYEFRAFSLHLLGFHSEAIEDFVLAIQKRKAYAKVGEDCNLYFMCSLSRFEIGDYNGATADSNSAIRLSRAENSLNQAYLEYAQKMGWENIAQLYGVHAKFIFDELELIKESEYFAGYFKERHQKKAMRRRNSN